MSAVHKKPLFDVSSSTVSPPYLVMELKKLIWCPSCDGVQTSHDLDGLVMDVCQICGGIWFGRNQLRQVIAKGAGALDEVMGFEPVEGQATIKHSEMRCPECKVALHSSLLANYKGVTVHNCYVCGGVFLDSTALQRLDELSHEAMTSHQETPMSPDAIILVSKLEVQELADRQRTQVVRNVFLRHLGPGFGSIGNKNAVWPWSSR